MRWPMVAVRDVVKIKGGGTPSKSRLDFYHGDIPWVTPKDMKFWRIESSIDMITQDAIANSATNLVPANSVLLVNRSGILKHTLPVGIAQRPVAINQDIKALIFSDRCDPQYAAHIIKASEHIVLGWVRATTADNFPIQNLIEMQIPLPPLDEQRRIAGILDAADALRRRRREALALLDTLPAAIFAEMFGDYKNNRHSWETVSFSEACADRTSRSPKVKARDYADAGKLPVVDQGAALVAGFVDDLDLANTSPLPVVVFGDHTRHVKLINFRFATGADGAKVLEPREGFRAEYLAECLRALPLPELGYSRHMRELKRQEFPKPPIDRQTAFSDRVSSILEQRRRYENDLRKLETLFASLQSRAFAGEL